MSLSHLIFAASLSDEDADTCIHSSDNIFERKKKHIQSVKINDTFLNDKLCFMIFFAGNFFFFDFVCIFLFLLSLRIRTKLLILLWKSILNLPYLLLWIPWLLYTCSWERIAVEMKWSIKPKRKKNQFCFVSKNDLVQITVCSKQRHSAQIWCV